MMINKGPLLVLAALCCLLSFTNALTLQVEPKTEECFFQFIDQGKDVTILYSVTRGGLLDIDVRIFDPRGNTLYQGLHFDSKMKGRQNFYSQETGVYKLCFNNEISRFTAKVVSFSIQIGDDEKSNVAKPADLTPMEASVGKIERFLLIIIGEQRRMRVREQVHRDTSENTNTRVQWWSLFETLLIVAMCVAQVWYLRRWFNVKTRV
eukprot:Phypoly_transcript_19085.p1 GENE.Phypoly_transcript_19085~~Phypoly_transcript_19085.p1  ORF type:complete len:207 (+),score=25.83 Phypoly_transcript_19085:34-654(+)